MYLRNVILATMIPAMAAFAQSNPIAADSPFQVRYAANLNIGESYINITNTGAIGASLLGPGFGAASGNICANVYAFDPNEELISCCSCLVTPGQTVNLGVNRDLTVKTLTGVVPTSVTIKLLSTAAGGDGTGTNCTNSAVLTGLPNIPSPQFCRFQPTINNFNFILICPINAWGTTLHASATAGHYDTTETPFTPATLNAGEAVSIGGRCANILGNGSGFGICNSCRTGALGAQKLQ
jgi:hypothetical protein